MSDPERLAARGDLGGALLRAGRAFDAERAHERRQVLIGAGAATATAAAAKAAAPKGLLHLGLGKWIAVGVLAATAVVPVVFRRAAAPRPAAAPVETASRSVAPPAAPTERVHVDPPVAPPTEPEPIAPAASAAPLAHRDPAPHAKPPPEASPVAPSASAAAPDDSPRSSRRAWPCARVRRRARSRCSTTTIASSPGAHTGARWSCSASRLSLSGAKAEARARAQRFLALHADSPYAARARVHLGPEHNP